MAKEKQPASSSPKRSKTPRKRASAATNAVSGELYSRSTLPPMYALGPQHDGSIVMRVDSDFDLMILRKAIEKQAKNSTAAEGTIGALTEGTDPLLDQVQRSLARLHKIIATARAPENQIADTPIGKAIAAAGSDTTATTALAAVLHPVNANAEREQVDGADDGIVWAPSVPRPRPRRGETIELPNGGTSAVRDVLGWLEDILAFEVFCEAPGELLDRQHIVAHGLSNDRHVWRIYNGAYDTPRVVPSLDLQLSDAASLATPGQELLNATVESDQLLADAPVVAVDEYEIVDTDAAGESRVTAPAAAAPQKARAQRSGKQRDRNASHNGLKKPGGKRK